MTPRTACHHAAPSCRHRHGRRGVVLVITLLALVFLAALVFYVFNLGRGLQTRIETQHAADAAATAGAGWVARSMNTVAMNNVAMARYLALVNVLDAMPMTVAFTHADQQAMLEAVERQISAGTGDDPWLMDDLATIQDELQRQVDMLQAVDEQLNAPGFDIRETTFYRTPEGTRGELWRAMETLEQFNHATLESLGSVAQAAAVLGGEANLTAGDTERAATAILVPGRPRLEWMPGQFNDLEGPVRSGLTRRAEQTGHEPNWHHYRGPFDAVFGWRDIRERIERGEPPGDDVSIDESFGSSWSEGPVPSPGPIISREPIYYSPYGMHEGMLRRFHGLNHTDHTRMGGYNRLGWRGPLRFSGFNRHLHRLADIKLGYLWPGQLPAHVIEPRWVTNFPNARRIHRADDDRIHEFRFIELRYTQIITPAGPLSMQLEQWSIRIRPDVEPPGLEQRAPHIWRDEQLENIPDRDIDGDGEVEALAQRRLHYYIFGGANVGRNAAVRNPYNFQNRASLPAPVRLDHQVIKPDDQATREHRMTFLAVARQPRRAALWSGAFERGQAQSHQLAVAQARVFNDHSWDLWTQMWHAQLEPVGDLDRWLYRLEDYKPCACGAADASGSREQVVDDIRRHLESVRDLAPLMLKH